MQEVFAVTSWLSDPAGVWREYTEGNIASFQRALRAEGHPPQEVEAATEALRADLATVTRERFHDSGDYRHEVARRAAWHEAKALA